ncbi:MAG: trypsin-like peptidase domain-containing protein [Candidatus Omnitrophica bacterium]|nr:trypsin-like peptidase domain-containing protein [Candidatus Omnitrophota bacterium]
MPQEKEPEEVEDGFCHQPIGPWIMGLVALSVMSVFWVVMKREDILQGVKEVEAPKVKLPIPGEPSFPGGVMPAAMTTLPTDSNYVRAAITKATPYGNMQLVANQVNNGGFQDSLKYAVNAIIPSVCDVHARHVVRTPVGRSNPNAQNLQFVPPFSGAIDKFIENKGFENIGAGIVVDERGFVLTNYHVIAEATDIVVTVFGQPPRDIFADVVAQDPKMDMAILKLRADGPFPEAAIGDSSFSQIGDYVVAVGSPFGIEQTVTSGIISGIRKSIAIEGVQYGNLFQTDTAINRGSSGGPLVNLKGEVIGMNTAIYAPTGVFSGTGFAIPINDCKDFLSRNLGKNYSFPVDQKGLLAAQQFDLPNIKRSPVPIRFGLEVMPMDSIIAKQFGLRDTQGVLVNRVVHGSPAENAGIQRGDVVLSVAGVLITDKDEIPKVVQNFRAGENVNVRILRNGKEDEILVRLQ